MNELTFLLIGRHIEYSASPAMMNAAFAALGMPHRYERADVAPDALPATIERLRRPNAGGANVTTPHKVAVSALVDEMAPDAAGVGAVNTVVRADGRLVGLNTDLPALEEAISSLCDGPPGRVALLGGGGAGRAVRIALERCGAARVVVISRSAEPAVALGAGTATATWGSLPAVLAEADLVVNATPVGTAGDETPVAAELLRPDLAVLDLVYRPSPTRLVREARAVGARARAGAGVLLGQGRRSLELWLGRPAPVEAMRAALRSELGEGADV
jgi:shikimate dehydrogenase